jgi:hypothetical protein
MNDAEYEIECQRAAFRSRKEREADEARRESAIRSPLSVSHFIQFRGSSWAVG